MIRRRRFKQTLSLKDRLAAFANNMRKQAANNLTGRKRDDYLMRAQQADTASHLAEWISSPGLKPPK